MRLAAVYAHIVDRDGVATEPVSFYVPPGSVPRDLEVPILRHGLFGWRRTGCMVLTFQWEAEDGE